jgi:hypothetical protein
VDTMRPMNVSGATILSTSEIKPRTTRPPTNAHQNVAHHKTGWSLVFFDMKTCLGLVF